MKKSLSILLLFTVCSMFSGCGSSGGNDGPTVTPIPDAGPTVLPAFYGAAVGPAPIAPPLVPQNPFLAPNPFSNVHSDTWMSDTVGFVGPLGRDPAVFSSTLEAARRNPNSPTFICSSIAFDSAGRLVMSCAGSQEASLVLADPDTLGVLASVNLPLSASAANATSSAYTYLDQQDRIVVGAADNTIKVMQVVRGETGFSFQKVAEYDVSPFIHPDANGNPDSLIGVMPDWQGRIWFAIRAAATVGVIDPATYPAASSIQTFALNDGGEIKNGFAVNQTDAYVVSTKAMYRITAGSDGVPRQVWSAGYGNIGTVKPGQYSAGSGTTPTLLGHGEYVAIADNDAQTHVVVYRTAEPLAAGQNRMVCTTPVFGYGQGAVEDSLIGNGLSLIVENNYGYQVTNWQTLASTPSLPGMARVDVLPDGSGCTLVWTNETVTAPNVAPKLATGSGLIYTITRKYDTSPPYAAPGLDVWYWSAVDFRTGAVVWERRAGTGPKFDSWYPGLAIGPNGTAYSGQYGGLIAIRDTR